MDDETRQYFDSVMKTVNTKLDDILRLLTEADSARLDNEIRRLNALEGEIRRLRPS